MQNGYALATDGAGGPDGYGYPPQNMNGDGNMQMGMGMPIGMGAGGGGGGVGAMPMPLSGRMPVAVGGVVQAGMEPRSPPSKQSMFAFIDSYWKW